MPSRKIAVVEDDEQLAELLCEYMRGKGMEAVGYSTVEEINFSDKVDAYVMDWTMGTGTTAGAIGRIRELSKSVPILLLSGNNTYSDEALAALIESDMVKYMEKPVRMKNILDELAGMWEGGDGR